MLMSAAFAIAPAAYALAHSRTGGAADRPRPLALHQDAAQDLARRRLGDLGHELDLAHALVGRNPPGNECHELLGRGGGIWLQDHERLRDLARLRVGLRD